jgi:hypothetical protein
LFVPVRYGQTLESALLECPYGFYTFEEAIYDAYKRMHVYKLDYLEKNINRLTYKVVVIKVDSNLILCDYDREDNINKVMPHIRPFGCEINTDRFCIIRPCADFSYIEKIKKITKTSHYDELLSHTDDVMNAEICYIYSPESIYYAVSKIDEKDIEGMVLKKKLQLGDHDKDWFLEYEEDDEYKDQEVIQRMCPTYNKLAKKLAKPIDLKYIDESNTLDILKIFSKKEEAEISYYNEILDPDEKKNPMFNCYKDENISNISYEEKLTIQSKKQMLLRLNDFNKKNNGSFKYTSNYYLQYEVYRNKKMIKSGPYDLAYFDQYSEKIGTISARFELVVNEIGKNLSEDELWMLEFTGEDLKILNDDNIDVNRITLPGRNVETSLQIIGIKEDVNL